MYKDRREKGAGFLATSLHKLDSTLHGGLPSSTVTEVDSHARSMSGFARLG